MRWFGIAYGAPYEADTPHTDTPVDEPCGWCSELIGPGDSGVLIPHWGGADRGSWRPYHYDCHFRGIVGGLNHLRGACTCCGGTEPPDPPNMTTRNAATAAVALWRHLNATHATRKELREQISRTEDSD